MSKIMILFLLGLVTFGAVSEAEEKGPWNGNGRGPIECNPGNGRGPGRGRLPPCNDRGDRNDRGERRSGFETVGTFVVQKLLETTNVVRVNSTNVRFVRLMARNNGVEITEARVLLDNGREIYMDGITGGLRQDRAITYTLSTMRGVRVRSITIRAITRNLIGSRATLEVSVAN